MDQFWEYFSVLAPSIGVFLVFWFVYRAITRADALERETEEQIRQEVGANGQPAAAPRQSNDQESETADFVEETEPDNNS